MTSAGLLLVFVLLVEAPRSVIPIRGSTTLRAPNNGDLSRPLQAAGLLKAPMASLFHVAAPRL